MTTLGGLVIAILAGTGAAWLGPEGWAWLTQSNNQGAPAPGLTASPYMQPTMSSGGTARSVIPSNSPTPTRDSASPLSSQAPSSPSFEASFLNPLDGAQTDICPYISGAGPGPTDGHKYFLISRFLTIPGSDYWLAASVTNPRPRAWEVAKIDIGNRAESSNGRYELLLVLADRDLSIDYEGRFVRTVNGEKFAKDLGSSLPPNIVKAKVEIYRTSIECRR